MLIKYAENDVKVTLNYYGGKNLEAYVKICDSKDRLSAIASMDEARAYDRLIEETFQNYVGELDEFGEFIDATTFFAYVLSDANVPEALHINTLRRSHTCNCWFGINGYRDFSYGGQKALFANMVIIPDKKSS